MSVFFSQSGSFFRWIQLLTPPLTILFGLETDNVCGRAPGQVKKYIDYVDYVQSRSGHQWTSS